MWHFKVKESIHFVEQNYKLWNGMENEKSHTVLERQILCFSSYKNRILKVKLWWVGAREKKRAFFVRFILIERNFCVLFQWIAYWIHFQNIHTFTWQKTFLYKLLLLDFKIVESLQRILRVIRRTNTVHEISKWKIYYKDSVNLLGKIFTESNIRKCSCKFTKIWKDIKLMILKPFVFFKFRHKNL